MKNPTKANLFFLLILILCIGGCKGCKPKIPEITWDYSNADVFGTQYQKSDQIDIDIYVDATTSMEGFAVNTSSNYSQFLDQLEASALSAWKKADPKFYKFGEKIKRIDRNEFLTAKNDVSFYRESGFKLKTRIDSVVQRTNPDRLSVLITDLFQDEADVNIMVQRFKEKCFAKGIVVGIIGVMSEFNGTVFDVPSYPGGYPLNSKERPFYAITFGNRGNMEQLFESLKTKPFIKEDHFLIFSPFIVKSFDIKLSKTKESKYVNKIAPRKDIKNSFDFSLKEEGTEASFMVEINLDRNTRCPDFSVEKLEIVTFKKSQFPGDKNAMMEGVNTDDIKIENIQRTGDKISAVLNLKNEDEVGNFSYLIYLRTNQLNGLMVPEWIKEYSTDKPVPGTPSASLTYNLEKFTSTLLVANSSITPVYVAKFYLNIYKN
jgi:hypothetical protein